MFKKEIHITKLEQLYHVKRNKYKRLAEELKQQNKAKANTLRQYTNRVKESNIRTNRLLQSNQLKFY